MGAPKRTKIGDVTLDATISVRFSERVALTQYPVEEGANTTDHAREEPEDLTIEGVLSSFPLSKEERDQRGELERGGGNGYAEDQYETLRGYKAKRETLTVVTAPRTLENMVLTGLDRVVDSKLGGAVKFTATFKEIRFVKTENVRLKQVKKPTKVAKKATGKVDQSKQPGQSGSEQSRSTAKTFSDAFGFTSEGGGVAGSGP